MKALWQFITGKTRFVVFEWQSDGTGRKWVMSFEPVERGKASSKR